MSPRTLRIALYIFIPLILVIVSTSWIFEYLWLDTMGYTSIFWTLKGTKAALLAAAFIVAGVFLVVNFRILADRMRSASFIGTPLQQLNINLARADHQKQAKRLLTFAALVVALMFAFSVSARWDASLRFLWHEPYGSADPIFGNDIGYYLFQLPFWELIQTSLTVLAFLVIMLLTGLYLFGGLLRFDGREGVVAHPLVLNQLKTNIVVWLLLLAWGLYLDRYQLLFQPQGLVFGAGYTDVHIVLPTLWIMFGLVLLLAVLVGASRWMRLRKPVALAVGALVLVWIGGRLIVPGVVQQFTVEPNELVLRRRSSSTTFT